MKAKSIIPVQRMILLLIPVLLFSNTLLRLVCLTAILLLLSDGIVCALKPRLLEIHRGRDRFIASSMTPLSIQFTVRNRGPLPLRNILVEDHIKDLFPHKRPVFLLHLRPYEQRTLSYCLEGNHRGKYNIGPIAASGSGPFLAGKWQKETREGCEITILPRARQIYTDDHQGNIGGELKTWLPQFEELIINLLFIFLHYKM